VQRGHNHAPPIEGHSHGSVDDRGDARLAYFGCIGTVTGLPLLVSTL